MSSASVRDRGGIYPLEARANLKAPPLLPQQIGVNDLAGHIDETGMRHVEDRPFLYALSLIEGKWKLHILFHLWKNPVLRYSQLKRALGSVTHKMLSSRLKELEADGLITRHEYPQVPPKVEYSLSARGRTLMPVLHDLCEWGHEHMDDDATVSARTREVA